MKGKYKSVHDMTIEELCKVKYIKKGSELRRLARWIGKPSNPEFRGNKSYIDGFNATRDQILKEINRRLKGL